MNVIQDGLVFVNWSFMCKQYLISYTKINLRLYKTFEEKVKTKILIYFFILFLSEIEKFSKRKK